MTHEQEVALLEDVKAGRIALERIAVALEVAMSVPPTPATPPDCQHPVELRIDFGITNGVPDWECGECHFRPEIPAQPAVADAGTAAKRTA